MQTHKKTATRNGLFLSAGLIVASLAYMFSQYSGASGAGVVSSNSGQTAPTPTSKSSGGLADGSYTGSAADAYYGTVQVKAVVQGGKLTDVQFLQYPSDRGTSRMINSQAMPQLKSEAISAQSANVDGVSGASETSQAFKQSLASALSQAQG